VGRVLWGQLVNHSRNLCLKVRELARPDAEDGDDLPLETYCETIRNSAEEILE
jgi:predicted membrane chloride channel (bestrophin family)